MSKTIKILASCPNEDFECLKNLIDISVCGDIFFGLKIF